MKAFVLSGLFVGCLLRLQVAQEPEVPRLFAGDEVAALYNSPTRESCVEAVERWKGALAFEKLDLLEQLLRRLEPDEPRETLNYAWREGTHDFRRLAGRVHWALGELLGVRLGPVTPMSTPEDLKTLSAEASRLVAAYRLGVVSFARERKEPSTEELQRKYRGRIRPGITPTPFSSALAMRELLAEWFPIGKEIRTLAEIVGAAGNREAGEVSYLFDSGYGGVAYRFEVRDGRIESLNICCLE